MQLPRTPSASAEQQHRHASHLARSPCPVAEKNNINSMGTARLLWRHIAVPSVHAGQMPTCDTESQGGPWPLLRKQPLLVNTLP